MKLLLTIALSPSLMMGSTEVASAEVTEGADLSADWALALPGWRYEFPRDHGSHRDFKTEWWYFTGNLASPEGREFGYQLTFFRQGMRRELPPGITSRFAVRDLWFAHFAVADLPGQNYRHFHRWSRGAFGEAGAREANDESAAQEGWVWIEDWRAEQRPDGTWRLRAQDGGVGIELELHSLKAPVFHGADGVSQKAAGPGRASHYYSFTRLATKGWVDIEGQRHLVEGLTWYDHEWATNQLTAEQTGWDWFSLQFEDGSELMLFQIRTRDGRRDPFSGGTWIGPDGQTTAITNADFRLEPRRHWQSSKTEGRYPVAWELEIAPLQLQLQISTPLEKQEFHQPPIFYWEGAIRAQGTRKGQALRGRGYLEMTGYGSPIVGMQAVE